MESPCLKEGELCGLSCPVGGTWYSVIGDGKELSFLHQQQHGTLNLQNYLWCWKNDV